MMCAHSDVIVVRYANDIMIGFEFTNKAERFWSELKERMEKPTGAAPGENALIEFGRHTAKNRKRAGRGRSGADHEGERGYRAVMSVAVPETLGKAFELAMNPSPAQNFVNDY